MPKSNLGQLNKVGEKTEKALNKLGLKTILDLIFYFPYRYEKYWACPQISKIKINEPLKLNVKIDIIRNKRSFKRRIFITEALVSDDSGSLEVIWFNQPFITKVLRVGDQVSLAGEIKLYQGRLVMNSPAYEKINLEKELIHTQEIVPIYSLTKAITQKQLRFFIHQALEKTKKIPDYLPAETLVRQKLITLAEALNKIHFPKNEEDLNLAIQHFKFSEIFSFQLKSYLLKANLEEKIAFPLLSKIDDLKKFTSTLPFELTDDQRRAAWTIIQDLQATSPSSRLLQGDVGSGKTIVSFMAILNCLLNERQAAFMAPTEILAQQHYENSLKIFSNFNFKIAFLSSKKQLSNFLLEAKNKKAKTQEITEKADLVFGTQSLIQEGVEFKRLSLVVVDEQHRFGVKQRQKILEANFDDDLEKSTPHFLSMTATPIPRSLALSSFYGLKFSLISQKPQSRKKIITKIVGTNKKNEMYDFIRKEIEQGHQAFIICPLIDPSDKSGSKSVKSEYERLKKNVFPDIEIAILHGKMSFEEKDKIMDDFKNKVSKILLATSVIEVGIDIPNATVMLIEGAERFGLAQLHQFRGRVGRSDLQSYCFLSLGEEESSGLLPGFNSKNKSLSRLQALQDYDDGLSLAKIDLQNRGAGNFYGLEQSGDFSFRFADLFDEKLFSQVSEEIKILSENDPLLKKQPDLVKKIKKDLTDTHLE